MALKIKADHTRFRNIVHGRIKQNLKKYISKGEMIGKQGKETISIPIPHIEIPHFQFDPKNSGGVGQGAGNPGQSIDPAQADDGHGHGEAGSQQGEHGLDVEVTYQELAKMLGEVLELPNIQPKGHANIPQEKTKYTSIHAKGPESLRHFKRTFKQALRRQVVSGTYNPQKPIVIPTREDRRYRSWKTSYDQETHAVIVYMMDVSGSMGDEQKEIVRIESFWIDTWLRSQYKGIETRFIIHDAVAKEVDRETFFHTRESGGTMISSAYKLCADIIDADYPSSDYNIYPFHFSDGDNWSADDTKQCLDIMKKRLIPVSNVFCYGQVESPYGSGQFIKDVRDAFKNNEHVITSEIPHKDAIYKSIKDFLGKGR